MCEYEQRNLAIIEAIMLDLGVLDIEELPAKVHEIKEAAQHGVQRIGCTCGAKHYFDKKYCHLCGGAIA